jgi:lysophospholipase L1-like esterase
VVIFVNVRVPRPWESGTNSSLGDGVKRYPNALLVDWHGASAGHPEYFLDDGTHLTATGREVYATLIANQVEAARARWGQRPGCVSRGG